MSQTKEIISDGNEGIVIIKSVEDIPGGKALDVTGFPLEVIKVGHVVIKDAEGRHKPMPLNVDKTAYATLPEGNTVVGIVKASLLAKTPMAAIMVRGSVNEVASPYQFTAAIKAALPLIRFTQD